MHFRDVVCGVVAVIKRMTVEMEVELSGRPEKQDYGVRGSPEWIEVVDVKVDSVFMFGRSWTYGELRAEFGNLADWIVDHEDGEDWE